jgi:hypothetical protein
VVIHQHDLDHSNSFGFFYKNLKIKVCNLNRIRNEFVGINARNPGLDKPLIDQSVKLQTQHHERV